MQNFTFSNPTKIIFGRDTLKHIGREAQRYGKRALVVSGGGSARASGVLQTVTEALERSGVAWVECSGIVSNPVLSKVREGIATARKNEIEMIVAVGGGSVLDSAKAIAAGVPAAHDVWDFFTRAAKANSALPLLAVLTLAATGSEMNGGAVITNEETNEKFNFSSLHTYPKVSILDPTTTFTVSPAYSAYGAVDAVTHLLEPYFNNENRNSELQDGMVESLIRAIRKAITAILARPDDYDARATMMWAATLALNGITSAGMGATDFPVHMIEHSLSALYNIPHGAGLSIVLPGWLRYAMDTKIGKIGRLGRRVFDMRNPYETVVAEETIQALADWFRSIGSPVSLTEGGIPEAEIPRIAQNASALARIWEMDTYTPEEIETVLRHCV